jgi:hypothetical protein
MQLGFFALVAWVLPALLDGAWVSALLRVDPVGSDAPCGGSLLSAAAWMLASLLLTLGPRLGRSADSSRRRAYPCRK